MASASAHRGRPTCGAASARRKAAAKAESDALEADYEFARQSLAAAVARAYFSTIEAAQQEANAQETLGLYEEYSKLTDVRKEQGHASDYELAQIKVAHRRRARHAHHRAAGRARTGDPRDRSRHQPLSRRQTRDAPLLSRAAAPVPAGLPAQILERRPDIIAAERRFAAAFHRIERSPHRAPAALFPERCGGETAGIAGANTAGIFGKRVALVEKLREVGGAGINTGTLPSKTLRETALALSGGRSRQLFGVDLSLRREATVAEFMRHKTNVTAQNRRRRHVQSRTPDVETIHGVATFVNPHTVRVRPGGHLRGEHILVASGSSPVRPPEFPFEDPRVHDSRKSSNSQAPKTARSRRRRRDRGEYACTFAALGAAVHLIDGRCSLLRFLDCEMTENIGAR